MKICAVCDRVHDNSQEICNGILNNVPDSVDVVSGYAIEGRIRSTTTVEIFHARHIDSGRECKLALVKPASKRFTADATAAQGLFHSNITAVIESGELPDETAYAVTEAFDETSLRELIAERSLSLLDKIRIARQTAEAVHAIHAAGLLHGAVAPDSISVRGGGTDDLSVKLHDIDLGSAVADGVLANRFSMDSEIALIKYFAPERFKGENVKGSDVYSLGLLLYELLSDHPPFDGDLAAAVIDKHLHEKPPEIKIENFDLRMLLTHTLSEALQKQPSFRQSTADLFARQMRHIEQLATHVATPPPAVVVRDVVRPAIVPVESRPQVFNAVAAFDTRSEPSLPEPVIEKPPIRDVPVVEPEAHAVHTVNVMRPIPFVQPIPKRSRLKGMKKRLHLQITNAKETPMLPTTIDWQQPDDVPTVEDAREARLSTFDSEEEITHVRPPVERIEVDLDRPKNPESKPFALAFLPTLLTQRADRVAEYKGHSGFSGYQSTGRDLGKAPIYGLAIVALAVVGFGIFRIGSALGEDNGGYIGEARRPQVQMPSQSSRTDRIEPQPAVVNIPAQPVEIPEEASTDEEEPVIVKAKAVEPPRSAASDDTTPTRSSASKDEMVPVRSSSRKSSPIVPSTLVITRGKERPRAVIVAETPATRPIRPGSGATRPRIVGLPD